MSWCFYVSANSRLLGSPKTFKFTIVRKGLLSRKEDRKSMEEALDFARGVGLYESMGANDSYVFTREQASVAVAEIVTLLDNEAENESGDEDFADEEPDED